MTLRAYDNNGRTADCYSVVMPDGDVLAMSERPSHPQGVCTYLGPIEPDGDEIPYDSLPDACKRQVAYELATFYPELFPATNDVTA